MLTDPRLGAVTDWVCGLATERLGLVAAHLRGSVLRATPSAAHRVWQEIDVCLVSDLDDVASRDSVDVVLDDVLVDCGHAHVAEYRDVAEVLSGEVSSQLRGDAILFDPTGLLTDLQVEVRAQYRHPRWIAARCRTQRAKVDRYLRIAADGELLAAARAFRRMAGVIAVADLGTPTKRRCLIDARAPLRRISRDDLYEDLLAGFGCGHLREPQVEAFLRAALDAYEYAMTLPRMVTPFQLRISPRARRYVEGGARDMLAEGAFREAMYWIFEIHTTAAVRIELDVVTGAGLVHLEQYDRVLLELGMGTPHRLADYVTRASDIANRIYRAADEIAECALTEWSE